MSIIFFNKTDTLLTTEQVDILTNFFGYGSGLLLNITLIPQIIKIFRKKSAKDLSYVFLIISVFTSIFKFIYGILINELPIVITSPIILIETLIIIISKIIYDKRDKIKDKNKKKNKKYKINNL